MKFKIFLDFNKDNTGTWWVEVDGATDEPDTYNFKWELSTSELTISFLDKNNNEVHKATTDDIKDEPDKFRIELYVKDLFFGADEFKGWYLPATFQRN